MRLTGDITPKSGWVVGFFTTALLQNGVSSRLNGISSSGTTEEVSVTDAWQTHHRNANLSDENNTETSMVNSVLDCKTEIVRS